MSKNAQPSKPSESRRLELRNGELSPARTLRIVAQLATEIQHLHDAGMLHRAISVEAVSVCRTPYVVSIETFPEKTFSFGAPGCDLEACPPELQRSTRLQVPAVLSDARQLMNKKGLAFDPVRIDIYQLGALLCRLSTGQRVESYLQSPKTTNSIPEDLRRLIDRALGYYAKDCFTELKDLQRDINELREIYPVPASEITNGSHSDGDTNRAESHSTPSHAPTSSSGEDLPFHRLGHYEIKGRIGCGGMGDVYKGYEKDLDRTVAIKVLPVELARSDEFVKRFYAEATAAAKLSHPNVIEVHYIGKDQGHHFFTMQYVEGESLSDLLRRRKRLEVQETVSIIGQALSGLAAAHKMGLVHRDIKPGNLLIDQTNNQVLLADFGLVKSIHDLSQMTTTGVVMGTVDYISPEQGRGKEVDGRSDLYAIGVLMYQMLSARLPFEADSPTAMIFQHVYESPIPLDQIVPDIPRSLVSIVDRLMAKSPDDRYQNAGEVLADLRASVAGNSLPSGADVNQPTSNVGVDLESSFQSVKTLEALEFGELTLPSPDLTGSAASVWWSRTRQRFLGLFRTHAPEFLQQLQNTQHQVDGAVAEYERRCERIQQLANDAEEVLSLHQTQARKYCKLATEAQARADAAGNTDSAELLINEKNKYERTADEFEVQIKDQQEQLEEIHLRLSQTKTTLVKVRTQRDLLSARLKVAHSKSQLAGGRNVNKRKRMFWIYTTLGTAIACSLFVAVVTFTNWTNSDNKSPKQIVVHQPQTVTNSIGMKFNLIPRGKFLMGSTEKEAGRYADEQQHEVEITQDYYLGTHELTQKQWKTVMGTEPWRANRNAAWVKYGDDYPATFVSWNDAVEFCKRLSQRDGNDYRLPTEAEWERACRANTTTRYSFGHDDSKLDDYAWNYDNTYKVNQKYAHRVGSKQSSPYGLHDMHGNVWEWCLDWYADDYYAKSPKTDPAGPETGSLRANRGGGWEGRPSWVRSANRGWRSADHSSNRLGFRVVRNGIPLTPSMDFTAAQRTGPKVEIVKAVFGLGRNAVRCEKRISQIIEYHDVMTEISTRGLQIRNPRGGYRTQLQIDFRVITGDDLREGTLVLKTESRVNIYEEILKHAAMKKAASKLPVTK